MPDRVCTYINHTENFSYTVGVVVPWGKKSDLDRCIESIRSQSYPVQELVVVGNANVSLADINTEKSKYSDVRIRFIHVPEVANANSARNIGLTYLDTQLVAFLDSDDWWDPSHLYGSVEAINDSGADMVYSGMRVHYSDKILERAATDYRLFGNMESYCLSYMAAPTGSLVCNRDAALNVMWDSSLNRHQDYDFKARFAEKYKVIYKAEISVNVDWTVSVGHKHYRDCFRMLMSWKPKVSRNLYRRHYTNLMKQALKDGDFVCCLGRYPQYCFIRLETILHSLIRMAQT